ncbi:hypothetical protein ACLOJK_010700 [Asimina triloba]
MTNSGVSAERKRSFMMLGEAYDPNHHAQALVSPLPNPRQRRSKRFRLMCIQQQKAELRAAYMLSARLISTRMLIVKVGLAVHHRVQLTMNGRDLQHVQEVGPWADARKIITSGRLRGEVVDGISLVREFLAVRLAELSSQV